jgi:hypothetical protein
VYGRDYGDRQLNFEASGALWQASLVMRDRETDSWWSIMTSRAIGGEMNGADLVELPYGEKTTWGEWRTRYPDSLVLSVDGREHEAHNPYDDYFAGEQTFRGLEITDRRLPAKEPIFSFFLDGQPYAVPHAALEGRRLFELTGGVTLLFSRQPGAELFASTRAWKVPAEVDAALPALPLDDGLEGAGFVPLGGIDTFWYTWAAVNEGTKILR